MSEQSEIKQCGCQNEGLAIFPTRYAVLPTYIKSQRPSWANLAGVTDIPLNDDYQYHIRRLRAGFIYIYLPSNQASNDEADSDQSESAQEELENQYWLIYYIDEQGRIIKLDGMQSTKSMGESNEDQFQCPNLKQNPTLNAFITIPNPSRYSKVYIAYSEFPWTVEAMKEYRQSPTTRMQELDIEAWQNQQYNQSSATIATEKTITDILDFNFDFIRKNTLPDTKQEIYGKDVLINGNTESRWLYKNKPSMELNQNYENIIQINTTEQSWIPFKFSPAHAEKEPSAELHQLNVQQLQRTMQSYSGDHGKPMILALEDALGVAIELNNYYKDIFAHFGQFLTEAEMEFDVKEMMKVVKSYSNHQVTKDDFSFSPTQDAFYQAMANNKNFDDIDFLEEKTLNDIRYRSNPVYDDLKNKRAHQLDTPLNVPDVVEAMERMPIDRNIKAPATRDYYQLVRCYILLVKEHFYAKPLGHQYYQRFMKFLKVNYYGKGKPFYERVFLSDPLIDNQYIKGSIYDKAMRYKSFKYQAPIALIRQDAQLMHNVYQDLVQEYEKKAKEHKSTTDIQTEQQLKKYKRCLIAHPFENIEKKLTNHVNQIANKRAKLLVSWLKTSHYLTFINDLSYKRNIELDESSPTWAKYQKDIENELKAALKEKEIESFELNELKKINLNGYYFTAVVYATLEGLEKTDEGKAFIDELQSIDHINMEGEVYIHIKTSILNLLWRAISFDYRKFWDVLPQIIKHVVTNQAIEYAEDILVDIGRGSISMYAVQIRKATLVLDQIMELKRLQKLEGLTTISIDTSFGKQNFITRWLSNYDNPGLINNQILKLYDNLLKLCKPINKCLYSLGAMIAESAALALSGVVWKSATTYAHMKYQVKAAYKVFKAQSFSGAPVGGGLNIMLSTYPAKVKKMLDELRQSLNTTIKQLDKRFVDQFVELDHIFKDKVNVVFKVFSDDATKMVSSQQIRLRSARLAFLVGAFEAYNWHYIMTKEPSLFEDDTDILLEKAIATSSLIAAVSDTAASIIRARNRRAIKGFRFAKTGFGVFTALTCFLTAAQIGIETKDNFESGNTYAAWVGVFACGLSTTSGGLYLLLGLSYRYEWVKTLFKVRVSQIILRTGLQKTFNLVACRLLLSVTAGVISFGALIAILIFDLIKDNDIEVFLKFSVLGKERDKYKFNNAFEQIMGFKNVEELKGFFDESQFSSQQANSQPKKEEPTNQDANQQQDQHHTIMFKTEQFILKWLDDKPPI